MTTLSKAEVARLTCPEHPRVYRDKKSCLRDNFLVSVRDENLVSANGSKMPRETILRKLVSADVLQHVDDLASGPEQGPDAPPCCQRECCLEE
jgi:hypothetical protein